MFLKRLVQALGDADVKYALVGGFAVALHGVVRGTVDIDLVLAFSEANFIAAEKVLLNLGLSPRLPVQAKDIFNFREEYIKNKNLIAWSFCNINKPSEIVDIIITFDAKKVKIVTKALGALRIPVASIQSLIEMKSGTGREQDRIDVAALRVIR